MSGRVGDLSPKQREALEKFRANIIDTLKPGQDDHYLLRWLRARNFDLTKTEMMLRENVIWRKEIGADTILDDYQEIEVLEEFRTGGICGTDKSGCPVYIDPYGLIDMKGLLRSAKKTDIIRKFVHLMETLTKLCQLESKKRGTHIEEVVVIYDLNGLGITDLNMQSVSIFLSIIELCQSRYPEMLKKVFVINCPRIFSIIWSLVRPLLHEKTAKKVIVVSGIYKEILLKQIDAEQLPACYGGTKTDPDGDPRCKTLICQGGTIPRQYYKTKKPHEGMTAVNIRRGSSLQLEYEVSEPNTIIRFEFLTEEHDIGFGLFRRTSTENSKANKIDTILSTKRIDCHLVPEDGEVKCESPGKYVVIFDNTYSSFLSKSVYYLIEVLKPDSTSQSSCTGSDKADVLSKTAVGYPLRKRTDDTIGAKTFNDIGTATKSVGLLVFKGHAIGTVFRVGSKFICTAYHVVEKFADKLGKGDEVWIDFNNELMQQQKKVYHLTNCVLHDKYLDFAIVEIADSDPDLPPPLKLDKDSSDLYDLNVSLIGFGHPQKMEKTVDPKCKLVPPTSQEIVKAKEWTNQKLGEYRSALKILGKNPNIVDQSFTYYDMEGKFLLHCYMETGASGAPAVATNDWEMKVIGILTHGLPEYYYLLPQAMKKNFDNNFCFGTASKMSCIYQCISKSDPNLAADLFSV